MCNGWIDAVIQSFFQVLGRETKPQQPVPSRTERSVLVIKMSRANASTTWSTNELVKEESHEPTNE
jgi:hypothetical protein